ncbi:MAG: hypothetical protein RIT28_938 [Pseudomonadota bacterium]
MSPMLLLLLTACPKTSQEPESTEWSAQVLADMDPTVQACDDFYRYSCGGWLNRTALPSDKPAWTRSFSEIAERNRQDLKTILEQAAAQPDLKTDPDWKKLGSFYGACMDEAAVNTAGVKPMAPLLDQIARLTSFDGLPKLLGELHLLGVDALFGNYVEGDYKDPKLTIFHLGQAGLGLPDRDYYLKDDADSKQLLADYEAHIAQVFVLAGVSAEQAAADAKSVLALEVAIAKAHKPRDELRDPEQVYHRLDRVGLEAQAGSFRWADWLAAMGAPDATAVNVEVPEVLVATLNEAKNAPITTLQAYLRFHTLSAFASNLSEPFVTSQFEFFGKKITGQQAIEPRWKRCVRATDSAMGEALGRYFVEQRFAGQSKDKAQAMITGIQDAFEAQLPQLAWMDDATRARAVEKKNALMNMVGYPDKWRDYSALDVSGTYAENTINARRFESLDWTGRVGKPSDPTRWLMSPAAVNAYYHPLYNQMVFPAGILQPPFFDAAWPSAMNFGAIGMVVGHELSHGFDDSGRKFDPEGRMIEWWAPEASAAFETQAQCVEDQFDGYVVTEGLNQNGALTLGENIADLGGLKTSFNAWKAQYTPGKEPSVPGLTDEQLFFVAFAQSWCTVASPEYEKMLVLSDTHSLPRFRVNGPASNLPEFHATFGCEAGKPMHPENICEVW